MFFFCIGVVAGFNVKNKHQIQYSNLPSAMRLISCRSSVPIPLPPRVLETVKDSFSEEFLSDSQLTGSSEYKCDDDQYPKPFNQDELNVLVCSYSGFQVEKQSVCSALIPPFLGINNIKGVFVGSQI